MRSSRETFTLLLTLIGGVVFAMGATHACHGVADEWGMGSMSGMYGEDETWACSGPTGDPMADTCPAPASTLSPMEQADHFDTGPVWDEEDVAMAGDESPEFKRDHLEGSIADNWEDTDDDAAYRYEYPENEYTRDDEYHYYEGAEEGSEYEYTYEESKTSEKIEPAKEETGDFEYSYDYDERESEYGESEYDYQRAYINDYFASSADEPAEEEAEAEETSEWESAYDYDKWGSEYGASHDDYQSEYANNDFETAAESVMEEAEIGQTSEWESAYEYDEWDPEYGYGSQDANDDIQTSAGEAAKDEAAVEETGEWESAYDYDEWDSGYGYRSRYSNDDSQTSADEATVEKAAVEETGTWESAYKYDEWDSGYGYGSQYTNDDFQTSADEATADKAAVEETGEWEPAYDYACPEERYGYSSYVEEDFGVGVAAEEAEEETLNYQGYSEAYPEEEYSYPNEPAGGLEETGSEDYSYYGEFGYDHPSDAGSKADAAEAYDYESEYVKEYEYPNDSAEDFDSEWQAELEGRLEGEPGEAIESTSVKEPYGYDYADPYEYYGYDCYGKGVEPAAKRTEVPEEDYCQWADSEEMPVWKSESEDVPESGLELFAWQPADLLLSADQEVLRTLETLCEEPSGVRRAALNDYLEALGWEAIGFASRFEDITGIEVLGLADDLPGAAAFFGVLRLMEQGELGMDEAVDLLRRSLGSLSIDWIEGVNGITADAYENWNSQPTAAETDTPDWSDTTSATNPVIDVMVSLAARSLAGLGGAISSASRKFSELDWQTLVATAVEGRAAGSSVPGDYSLQR